MTTTARGLIGAHFRAWRFVGQVSAPGWTWEDAPLPMAGETMRYSDLRAVEGPPADTDFFVVPFTSWSDYSGSTLERSNAQTMLREHPERVLEVTGEFGLQFVAVSVGDVYDTSDDGDDWQIVEHLRALTQEGDTYPVLDEDDMATLETLLASDAWDIYGAHDLRRELATYLTDVLRYESDSAAMVLVSVSDDALLAHYWAAVHETGDWPRYESATSAVLWSRGGRIVPLVAGAILEAG